MILGKVEDHYSIILFDGEVQELIDDELLESLFVVAISCNHVLNPFLLVRNRSNQLDSLPISSHIGGQVLFESVISRLPCSPFILPRVTGGLINKDDLCICIPVFEEVKDKGLLHSKHLLLSLTAGNPIRRHPILDVIPQIPVSETKDTDVNALMFTASTAKMFDLMNGASEPQIDDFSPLRETKRLPSPQVLHQVISNTVKDDWSLRSLIFEWIKQNALSISLIDLLGSTE